MQKDDLIYVGHMLDMSRRVATKVETLTREQFNRDENLQLALAHLIQVIGEAARRVSPEFQRTHDRVPWRSIVGMRHKIVHDYLQLDLDILWDVAKSDLPGLAALLEQIVPDDP
jgi:uncharacterized protein with HEPN domain